MNITFITLGAVALLAAIVLACAWLSRRRYAGSVLMANAELGAGVHQGSITKLADAATTQRHLLFKDGSDDDHTAACSASADVPLGTVADEASAAGYPLAVQLLGKGSTKRMVQSGQGTAIAVGDEVFTATGGKVQSRPSANGTYWYVGVCIAHPATAEDDIVEVSDCAPQKLVIG